MRTIRLIPFLLITAVVTGCGESRPTLCGGRPVGHWLEALHDPAAPVRKAAVAHLGNAGPVDPEVVPALTRALRDPDAGVRAAAVMALVKAGPAARATAPALAELRHRDASPRVRAYAGQALSRLQAAGDVP